MRNGTTSARVHKTRTFIKWSCQNLGATSGKTAMESSIPTNGIVLQRGSTSPKCMVVILGLIFQIDY
jgi:hypothetical protein